MSRFVERLSRLVSRKNRKAAKPAARPRLAVEHLEDRTTPAIFLNFAATPVVEVNPQPLPPQALVLFTPEPTTIPPGPTIAGAPTAVTPFHIQGELKEAIQGGWTLDAVYTLDGQVSIPPGPSVAGALDASYSYAAHVTEALTPPGPQVRPVWVYDATESSQGEESANFISLRKAGGRAEDLIAASFHDDTTAQVFMRKAGGVQTSWKVDAAVASQGAMLGQEDTIGGGTRGAGNGKITFDTFAVQRRVDEALTPVDPMGNPGPAWHIYETVVTKDVSHRDRLTGSDGGRVVQDHGHANEVTRVEASVTPPATPGEPPPTPDVFTDAFQAHEDYNSIIIEGG